MKRPDKSPTIVCGSIRADELLPLQEFLRRLKIGRKTWYSMKRAGLRSCSIGKQTYILGRDVLSFFGKLADKQAAEGDDV